MRSSSALAISCKSLILLAAVTLLGTALWGSQWAVLGPDGGDARSLSYDPHNPDRIFLGNSTGTLFVSEDAGHSWARFAHLGDGNDYVLDHVVISSQDSNTMFVAAWSVQDQHAGDVFRSMDGGKTWHTLLAMHGKSVRAFAISASDPQTLVAGALDGVFRSVNGGETWQKISPAGDEIKNVESLAIDPKDPNVIYAGTWHLAWKTPNGGGSWEHINKDRGLIDDSDVFSVIVDKSNSSVVFASACSGIYKSEDAGEQFHKIQGIPFTARRTRVLKQDPSNPEIVYAGTTEGLWKTTDLGKSWKRMSDPEVVVNDVMIDPRNSDRVLLATDRAGVLASNDGVRTLAASNHGYAHRYVSSIVADPNDSNALVVGLVNDRELGGVFLTHDRGENWIQKSSGLGGRDVFTLKETSTGELIAGTNRGIFLLPANGSSWHPINVIVNERTLLRSGKKGSKKTSVAQKTITRSVLDARVNDIEVSPRRWMAATTAGLFTSTNQGKSWSGGAVMGNKDLISVKSSGNLMVAATRTSVLFSTDSGVAWRLGNLPSYVTDIRELALTPDQQILIASREGAFRSADSGLSWQRSYNGLPDANISSITYDEPGGRLLATSTATGVIFESEDGGRNWHRGPDAGYPLHSVEVVKGRFIAATPFDGVVLQPINDIQSASRLN
ncbi:MAG TPA: transcriptional regulator [Terriglobales bacterium]|nr:transcriptional regulator [Terriglobales bacterium]